MSRLKKLKVGDKVNNAVMNKIQDKLQQAEDLKSARNLIKTYKRTVDELREKISKLENQAWGKC